MASVNMNILIILKQDVFFYIDSIGFWVAGQVSTLSSCEITPFDLPPSQ